MLINEKEGEELFFLERDGNEPRRRHEEEERYAPREMQLLQEGKPSLDEQKGQYREDHEKNGHRSFREGSQGKRNIKKGEHAPMLLSIVGIKGEE